VDGKKPASASQEVAAKEDEAAALEHELEQEAAGLLHQVRWLERRFEGLQQGLRRLEEHGQLHPDLAEVEARLLARLPVPPSVEVYRQEVMTARQQALIVRGRVHQRMRRSVDTARQQLEQMQTHVGRIEGLVQAHVARLEGRPPPLPAEAAGAVPASQASMQLGFDELEAMRVESTASLLPPGSGAARLPGDDGAPSAAGTEPERRYEHRVPLQAEVDFESESNLYSGFSTNLSEGGIFVATVKLLPIGTPVDLNVTLPGEGALALRGVVRWTRILNIDTPDVYPGIGVQFVDLTAELSAALRRFLAHREPLFYPD
jgi:uncharacterized protein (TIGR02266 family)